MCPVHLRVVELERNSKCRFQQAAFVFAPNQKGIVKYAAVHADGTVYFILCQGGSADDHAFRQVVVDTAFRYLFGKLQIMLIEQGQIIGERNIARTDFMPVFRLILTRRDTLRILKNVTIGMGAFIHISKAYARLVSWGFTSFMLLLFLFHILGDKSRKSV